MLTRAYPMTVIGSLQSSRLGLDRQTMRLRIPLSILLRRSLRLAPSTRMGKPKWNTSTRLNACISNIINPKVAFLNGAGGRSGGQIPKFYDSIDAPSRGAWVVHHGQKTASTVNGPAEFPALDAAAKAVSLLSQLASTEESTIEDFKVQAL